MKITICGSIAFIDEMIKIKKELEKKGHEVKIPLTQIQDSKGKIIMAKEYYEQRKTAHKLDKEVWDLKEQAMLRHFEKIKWSDIILVLNIDKKEIPGYIGGNTLMEMGIAQFLKKTIYLWNEIPTMSYTEEILGTKPIVINQNIERIK